MAAPNRSVATATQGQIGATPKSTLRRLGIKVLKVSGVKSGRRK